jgi:hypothetical protein
MNNEAVSAVREVLDGEEWTADTLDCSLAILMQAGYQIRDLNDKDSDDR